MKAPNKWNYLARGILITLLVTMPIISFAETTEVGSVVISNYMESCGDTHFSDKENQKLCLQVAAGFFLMMCIVALSIVIPLAFKIKTFHIREIAKVFKGDNDSE